MLSYRGIQWVALTATAATNERHKSIQQLHHLQSDTRGCLFTAELQLKPRANGSPLLCESLAG